MQNLSRSVFADYDGSGLAVTLGTHLAVIYNLPEVVE